MKYLLCALITTLITSNFIYANKVCILAFVDKDTREYRIIDKVFRKAPSTSLIYGPSFSDIKDCFENGYEEVLWVSHGITSGITNPFSAPVYRGKSAKPFRLLKRWFKRFVNESNLNIKKFRLAFCGGNVQKNNSMSPLLAELNSLGVDIDIHSDSKFASSLLGVSVVNLNKKWLAQSVVRSELTKWRTGNNFFCNRDSWKGCDRAEEEYVIPL